VPRLNEFEKTNQNSIYNGFEITTSEYIHYFYYHGIYLREIELPFDDPNLKISKPKHDTWIANKIILKERHLLSDPNTYVKFNIKIDINWAAEHGHINILEWFKNFNCEHMHNVNGIEMTPNNFDFSYNHVAID